MTESMTPPLQVSFEKNYTLLVEGPSKVKVKSGIVEVFGAIFKREDEIQVDPYRVIPLYCLKKSRVEVFGGKISLVGEDTIPYNWRTLIDKLQLRSGKHIKIMVLGGLDVGKTGLITFLANKIFLEKLKVGVIDADVGQSDIGPPTTIGLGLIDKPIASLSQAKLVDAMFIGSTSPSGLHYRIFSAILQLLHIAQREKLDVILIDTTGWITGRGRNFKIYKITVIQPNYIIGIQREDELEPILKWAEKKYQVYRVEAAEHAKARSREERRLIREYMYKKWFEKTVIKEIEFSKVTTIGTTMLTGNQLPPTILDYLSKVIGADVIYGEKTQDSLLIIIDNEKPVNESAKGKLAKTFNTKQVYIYSKSFFKNLLVAFQSKNKLLEDLGIIADIDFKNKKFKVLTKADLTDNIIMQFGQIKINIKSFREEDWIRIQ